MSFLQEILDIVPKQQVAFVQQFFKECPSWMMERMHLKRYPKNVHLIDTAKDSQYVFVLLEGKLQAIEERIVHIPYQFLEIEAFDIVGDYEVFTKTQGHYVTLKTMTPSLCIQISSTLYHDWMRQDANALFLRTQMMIQDLSIQTQQQRQYLFMDNKQRLISYILHYMEKKQRKECSILQTREQIASHIGCSVRQLNRILKDLANEHCISLHHGKIYVSTKQYPYIKEKANFEV